MARTVADVALLLSVMAGADERAPLSAHQPASTSAGELDRDLRGLRIGWSADLGGSVPVESEVAEVVLAAAERFAELGCRVEEACPDFTGADETFRTLRAWQFELSLGRLLDESPELVKPSLAANIEEGRKLSGPDLGRAAVTRAELYHRARVFFGDHDVLLLPVSQLPPFDAELEYPREVAGVAGRDYLDWMASCSYVSVLGHPALSVPAGSTADGLPVGVQLVGRYREDFELLRVAHAFERAADGT
nr:amidase family protein [Actinopolyspora xinjiangensis]